MKLSTALLLIAGGSILTLYFPEPGVAGLTGTIVGAALVSLGLMSWEEEAGVKR